MSVQGRIKKFLFAGGVAVRRLLLADADATDAQLAEQPSFTSGAGAPTSDMNEPDGSVYLRRDGAAATTVYVRAGGAWTAVVADGSDFGADGILADLVKASTTNAAIVVESNGTATSVKWKAAGTTATHRTVTFSTAALTADRTLTMPNANVDLTIVSNLAGTTTGTGASLVGLEDAAGSLAAANVEAALAELATPVSLTPGAEAADTIAVVVAGPAHVAQYRATVLTADMVPALEAAYTIAETGAGAEVSTTAKPSLLFTTDAAGAATLTVTDVVGGADESVFLLVEPVGVPGGAGGGKAAIVSITFDNA